ncbi:MAG: hybrid sensor histidine kinase/response regulator [Polaromonas sp. 39-63-203]|jgi:signal transduction histidine kinase|uniref:sensor histidine kinase n=1 Tax=Polaromonas sp. TaxID=1869339 RepID=UPI000BD189BB|nr:ATP-binding protein [Polaromonas sp.]OYY53913.1 MAG: hybrid sensor histidine kinase/response regulator [Polaromonas sp. 35-63-240]OYZ84904.1 MAG: hybrid sensor histidine kinase/response regulator [Polaromonas sp. 24-62-144]OZA98990.1 MAG: hybrid sensor histidine kinase/response regulator [Polaromonas sp. 39-63-203]HQS31579.1 ATP-binding protein [Polaromonas sp.]HQS90090.1 ATP-binding protein [Polaromonas sp.]
MKPQQNRRILLIDDMLTIHEDFRKILLAKPEARDLDVAEETLFGKSTAPAQGSFELDSAYQGRDGVAMVEAALQAGRPYAMAFVDMRMPPGWDGVETIERLWRVDPQVQIVICTAYSDHSWEDVLARLDAQDRLLIVKKPFDMIEISQLARTLTAKWALTQQAAWQLSGLEDVVRELKVTEAALRHSNQALESFSYSVAHDLRSPLKTIDGFSHLLQRSSSGETAERTKHYLTRIRAGVKQMGELTEGLLGLAQMSRAELKIDAVDLSALARQVLRDCQERDPARTVKVQVQSGLQAMGDCALLRQLLENLLANAWKFSAKSTAAEITVGQLAGNFAGAVYFVRDNGAGFDMAYADKLFGAFQRLHLADDFAGTGIGLATAHRVIARHAGRIWAEGAVGEGATFFFTVPEASPEQPGADRPSVEVAAS